MTVLGIIFFIILVLVIIVLYAANTSQGKYEKHGGSIYLRSNNVPQKELPEQLDNVEFNTNTYDIPGDCDTVDWNDYLFLFSGLTAVTVQETLKKTNIIYLIYQTRLPRDQTTLTEYQYTLLKTQFTAFYDPNLGKMQMTTDIETMQMRETIIDLLDGTDRVLSVGCPHRYPAKVAHYDFISIISPGTIKKYYNLIDPNLHKLVTKETKYTHKMTNYDKIEDYESVPLQQIWDSIDVIDTVKGLYDKVISYTWTQDELYTNEGPMIGNVFLYSTIKIALKLANYVKPGGQMVLVFLASFEVPALSKFFDLLLTKFKSHTIQHFKCTIIMTFDNANATVIKVPKMETKKVKSLFYEGSIMPKSYEILWDIDRKELGNAVSVGLMLSNQIKSIVIEYFTGINSKCAIGDEMIDNIIVDSIHQIIKHYEKTGKPYDKYHLSIVSKYYEDVYSDLISINNVIESAIVRCDKQIKITKNADKYEYNDAVVARRNLFVSGISMDQATEQDSNMRDMYLDFVNALPEYLQQKNSTKKLEFHDCQLWEIHKQYGIDVAGDAHYIDRTKKLNVDAEETYDTVIISGNSDITSQTQSFREMLAIFTILNKHGNCVVHCSLPIDKNGLRVVSSTFINLLYVYYSYFTHLYLYKPLTSDSSACDFYIICKKFDYEDGDDKIKMLKELLDDFQENTTYITRDNISIEFYVQIRNFIQNLTNYNIRTMEKKYFLYKFTKDRDNIVGFDKMIEPFKMKKIRQMRFDAWIDKFQYFAL